MSMTSDCKQKNTVDFPAQVLCWRRWCGWWTGGRTRYQGESPTSHCFYRTCFQTCRIVIGVGKHVFRFTTAAAHTPSWPSSSTRSKRVLSLMTSVWSHWARGRWTHTLVSIPFLVRYFYPPLHKLRVYSSRLLSCPESLHQCRGASPGQHPAHQRPLHGDAEEQTRWDPLTHQPMPTGGRLRHLCFRLTEKQHQEDGAKRKRGPAKSTCPYNKAPALQHMRDKILGAVQDIEQLVKLGGETRSCPYYSARLAIPPAQVTTSSPMPLHHCAARWFYEI